MRRLTARKVDIVAGAIFALLGVYVLYFSLQLDFYVESVPGPGFFPSLLAIVLTVFGLLLVVTRWRTSGDRAEDFDLPSPSQTKRSLGLWGVILASSLLIEIVGFFAAMLLLVAAILLGIEGRRGITTIVTIIVTPLLAFLLFSSLLRVPLPTGLFGS